MENVHGDWCPNEVIAKNTTHNNSYMSLAPVFDYYLLIWTGGNDIQPSAMGNAMKRFTEQIDLKMRTLANKMNAKVSKDRPEYPQALRTFEERRIDWIEDNINKAIIFQPNFELKGANEEKWNFGVAAWYLKGQLIYDFLRTW